MPVETQITEKDHLIVYIISDPLDLKDLAREVQNVRRNFVPKAPNPLYSITDLSRMTRIPDNILSGAFGIVRGATPKLKANYVVVKNNLAKVMLGALARVSRKPIYTVETFEEAKTLVEQQLAKLKAANPTSNP